MTIGRWPGEGWATGPAVAAADHIRHCSIGDEIIVLDLRQGRYSLLDSTASLMWQGLLSGTVDEVAGRLAAHFGTPVSQISPDVTRFIERCAAAGWFAGPGSPGASAGPPSPTRRPWFARGLTMMALGSMIETSARLRGGLLATVEHGRKLAQSIAVAVPSRATDKLTSRALRAFGRAENAWTFKAAPDDCLPRSLALFVFLRRLGLPAEHRIGVRAAPIEMHAWVELDGIPLLHDRTVGYTPIARTP